MNTDGAQSNPAIIPTRQEVVPLFDRFIVAVSLPDGRIAATLASLCEALGLTQNSQVRRIRMDDVLTDELATAAIETSSGVQAMGVLTAWAIPLWLTGIQTRKVAEEKRPAILAFKKQAANVLYEHFSQLTLPPPPVTLVPSEPIEKPSYPDDSAGLDERRKYHRDMVTWLDWQADIAAWQKDTNHRLDGLQSEVESLHEVVRLVPELLERMGPATLSAEHMSSVQALAKRLHEVGGFSFATIYGELNAAFHVGKYDQIADASWNEVTRWFTTRINAAEQRRR
jgi:P22_AR N-terminal domain